VLLTSHYMADVQALCERVIVIHHGAVLFDGQLRDLAQRFSTTKTITATMPDPTAELGDLGRWDLEVTVATGGRVTLTVRRGDVAAVAARLLADHAVTDLTIEDPPVDDVIEAVFASPGDVP
jgi:ABC-2 type transport system ATP-binding protein